MMKRRRYQLLMVLFLILYMSIKCAWLFWPPQERVCGGSEDSRKVCYLLNLDGMKGLGHCALLLTEPDGSGVVYSYNGMQYNLFWCLSGKAGVGKMMRYTLEPQDVQELLQTGNLETEDHEECGNFDRILYRCISEEQQNQIKRAAGYYVEAGNEYERLYAALQSPEEELRREAEAEMEYFLKTDLPRYQIYTHNCDTVARELLALVDEEVERYNGSGTCLTPVGNYKHMCRILGEQWGYGILGKDSLAERLLSF